MAISPSRRELKKVNQRVHLKPVHTNSGPKNGLFFFSLSLSLFAGNESGQ